MQASRDEGDRTLDLIARTITQSSVGPPDCARRFWFAPRPPPTVTSPPLLEIWRSPAAPSVIALIGRER